MISTSVPVRAFLLLFVAVALSSYAWAMLRGLPPDEVSPADNGLLRIAGWAGILLVASDGITTGKRLRDMLRHLALAGGAVAGLGLLQFLTSQTLLDWIRIPGMSSDLATIAGVDARSGYTRAAGTAAHPIEYAALLSMTFPIALAVALTDSTRSRLLRWLPVLAIAAAAVLSVSRSAVVGLLVGLLALAPIWSPRVRALVGASCAALVVAIGLLVPGMLGTIRGLFLGAANDPSALSRAYSQDAALEFIARFPIVGKGFGTFLPRYHILDNQFLLLTIELGVLGLLAFLGILMSAVVGARRAARLSSNPLDAQLSQALVASTIAGAALMAFFDAFSFSISAGLMFLALGLSASAGRLLIGNTHPAEEQSGSLR